MKSEDYYIVVIGGKGVGKSGVSIQFTQKCFIDDYYPTTKEPYRRILQIDKISWCIYLLDTTGEDNFSAFREQYARKADGFVYVYSITTRDSFEEISVRHEEILRIRGNSHTPVVLVANKTDLEYERQISPTEGRDLASSLGCAFFETSAKLPSNVEDAFLHLIHEIRASVYPQPVAKEKNSRSCSLQ